jgi:hypothetical protein
MITCSLEWLQQQAAFRRAASTPGFLDAKHLQQVLSLVGEFYTALEINTMLARMVLFEQAMVQVRRASKSGSDVSRIRICSFLGWLLSGRPHAASSVYNVMSDQIAYKALYTLPRSMSNALL